MGDLFFEFERPCMTYVLPQKYRQLDEAGVTKALADKYDSQIVQELACLIDIYTKQVAKIIKRGGHIDDALRLPTCALEKLAITMVIDAAQSTLKGQEAQKRLQ